MTGAQAPDATHGQPASVASTFTLSTGGAALIAALGNLALALSLCAQPSSEWVVTERGPHHNVHERTEVIDLGGRTETHTRRYVELATALNRLESGQWIPARAEFEILPGGYALCRQTQHRLLISPIINDANGAVDFETPDGKRMRSTILGLALRDRVTGRSLLVAEIVQTPGLLVAPNQILYADCFDDVHADVKLTVERSGYHQDVVMRERFDPVWLEANGFNKDTTRIEIWSEFFEAPQPGIRQRVIDSVQAPALRALMAEPDVIEHTLDFGVMKLPLGRAYAEGGPRGPGRSVVVPKRWVQTEGRTFLVESMSLLELEPLMANLPPRSRPRSTKPVFQAGVVPVSPELTSPGTNRILTAQVDRREDRPGVVWDYVTINGSLANLTLTKNTTFYINGTLAVHGDFRIEGGSVVKFNPAASSQILVYADNVFCDTGPFQPCVLSSMHDNTVGEVVSGSTGSPSIDSTTFYLYFTDCDLDLHDLRMRYSYDPLTTSGGSLVLRDSQFDHNDYPFWFMSTTPCRLENVLVSNTRSDVFYTSGTAVVGEHLTVHAASNLWYDEWSSSLALTNTLFAHVTNLSGAFVGAFNATNNTGSAFQTAVGGAHYLASGSPHRNAGTTNISADLLNRLQTRTTCPPLVWSNATITTNLTLTPQALGDTGSPDLGYHYDILDHAFGGTYINADVTVEAGTVLGWFRTSAGWYHAGHGIRMGDSKRINFEGTAESPTYWVRCNTVQESGNNFHYGPGGITGWATTHAAAPVISANYLRCAMLGNEWANHFRDDWGYQIVQASNSEFWGGSANGYGSTWQFTNCLFDCANDIGMQQGTAELSVVYRNCTVRRGRFLNTRSGGGTNGPIIIRDTVFEGTKFLMTGGTSATDCDYNAYLTGGEWFTNAAVSNVFVAEFEWQTGPLGNYYLPSNSPLVDAGSIAASAAGLYHYTTQTNQTKEAGSQLDIGYHFVAVDGNCVPLDTDSDTTPDYLDDESDGDGLPDVWEITHFGDLSQSDTDDTDEDAVSNEDEYLAGSDPNELAFELWFLEQYTSSSTATGEVTVIEGLPGKLAVVVDSTNFAAATWSGFVTNPTANLGVIEGWHDIHVGLRGFCETSNPVWHSVRVKLVTGPPGIEITSPAPGVVVVPFLQIAGYSPRPLSSIRFDLTNAAGAWQDEEGYGVRKHFDTNIWEFTTNWFELVDLELAPGTNLLTVRVTDWAGNISSTNLTFVFDTTGDTNPPVATITWPQDLETILSEDIYLKGTLDDATATVQCEVVNTEGTNTFEGLVERNGTFWVEYLTLAAGTNQIVLTFTDAATNVSDIHLTLIRGEVELAIDMDAITDEDLEDRVCTVTGTISDASYAVWVNGIPATINPDGTWQAETVPSGEGGTAEFEARAYPPGEHPTGPPSPPNNPDSANSALEGDQRDHPARIIVESYREECVHDEQWTDAVSHWAMTMNWSPTNSAHALETNSFTTPGDTGSATRDMNWPADGFAPDLPGTMIYHCEWEVFGDPGESVTLDLTNSIYPPRTTDKDSFYAHELNHNAVLFLEHCSVKTNRSSEGYSESYSREAQATLRLETGGKGGSKRKNLFQLTGGANRVAHYIFYRGMYPGPDLPVFPAVAPQRVQLGTVGRLGSDGRLWKVLRDNQSKDITPQVVPAPSPDYYRFHVWPTKHKLFIEANGVQLDEGEVVPGAEFCVGQRIVFNPSFDPGLSQEPSEESIDWTFQGKYVNKSWRLKRMVVDEFGVEYWEEYGSRNYSVDPDLLRTEQPEIWWVSGKFDPSARYTGKLGLNLTFPNGQQVVLVEKGLLGMHRPVVTNFWHPVGTNDFPRVQVSPRGSTPWLQLGNADLGIEGMTWGFFVLKGRAFACDVFHTQLIRRSAFIGRAWGIEENNTAGEYWVDGGEEYVNGSLRAFTSEEIRVDSYGDWPGFQCYQDFVDVVDDFAAYVRFQPLTPPGSIPITLGKVGWGWGGRAVESSVSWDISTSHVDGPAFVESDEFPQWEDVY